MYLGRPASLSVTTTPSSLPFLAGQRAKGRLLTSSAGQSKSQLDPCSEISQGCWVCSVLDFRTSIAETRRHRCSHYCPSDCMGWSRDETRRNIWRLLMINFPIGCAKLRNVVEYSPCVEVHRYRSSLLSECYISKGCRSHSAGSSYTWAWIYINRTHRAPDSPESIS